MKIISWNINGLRAGLGKGVWGSIVATQAEVICFQEIRVRPDQLTDTQHELWQDFEQDWHPAEKPGYSGVLTLSKVKPLEVIEGTGITDFDREGRVVRSRFLDFTLFNIYFPNGKRDLSRVPFKLKFYEKILELVDEIHQRGELVILTGDFNTAHQEIDLKNPQGNRKTTGFLPEERAWVDRLLEGGLVDIYRVREPERVQYTWWTFRYGARERNIGWRLDYFLISPGLVERVKKAEILDQVLGSDHCPITLELAEGH